MKKKDRLDRMAAAIGCRVYKWTVPERGEDSWCLVDRETGAFLVFRLGNTQNPSRDLLEKDLIGTRNLIFMDPEKGITAKIHVPNPFWRASDPEIELICDLRNV